MEKIDEVVSEQLGIFTNVFKIDMALIKDNKRGGTYNRLRVDRPDASAILIFNEETEKVILVKQFRYPVVHHAKGEILEVVAGIIDSGETPEQTAIREAKEEAGYKIKPDQVHFSIESYSAPGYSTERVFLCLAIVTNSDKVSNGGGLSSEHENIKVVELSILEFFEMISKNEIKDAKTILSGTLLTSYLMKNSQMPRNSHPIN